MSSVDTSSASVELLLEQLVANGVSVKLADSAPEALEQLCEEQRPVTVACAFSLPLECEQLASFLMEAGALVGAVVGTSEGCLVVANSLDRGRAGELGEIAARVEAAIRSQRSVSPAGTLMSSDGRVVCDSRREMAIKDGKTVPLSYAEWEILCCLTEQPLRIWTREELLLRTSRGHQDADHALPAVRTIDAHVKNLRRKLEDDPRHPMYLMTARQRGYYLNGFDVALDQLLVERLHAA